ncbi:MAG TPA: hypothetical protein VIY90_16060 [Steroidobacteraceae bacterium]
MSVRAFVLSSLAVFLGTACAAAGAQGDAASRVAAFGALPNWTGLWETELRADLSSGKIDLKSMNAILISRMMLLGRPPYRADVQRREQIDPNAGVPSTGRGGLPPSLKACSTVFPAAMDGLSIFQIFVMPEETLFLFEDGSVRHIYTDDRTHPRADDLWPTEMGDSIGHWEHGTLVIDTIARKAGPVAPYPIPGITQLTEQARFTERVRMLDHDTMQDELTIEDQAQFAQPWRLTVRYKRVTDLDRLIATNCTENDRNPVVNGNLTISPP